MRYTARCFSYPARHLRHALGSIEKMRKVYARVNLAGYVIPDYLAPPGVSDGGMETGTS